MDEMTDLVTDYQNVRALLHFIKTHEKVSAPALFVMRCQEWMGERTAVYEQTILDQAWTSLPARLRKWSTAKMDPINRLASKLDEAKQNGYSLLQVLSWSDEAFKAAALVDVGASIANNVEQLIEKGVGSSEGFTLISEYISNKCRQHGRIISGSSSGASNMAADAERVAWFTISERDLRSVHNIW
jgi:hypothetical protein